MTYIFHFAFNKFRFLKFFTYFQKYITLIISVFFITSTSVYAEQCFKEVVSGSVIFDVNGTEVTSHIPQKAIGSSVPLVVNLHPTGGSGQRTQELARHVADENGFVLMTPTGDIGPVFSGLWWNGWAWNVPGVPIAGKNRYPDDDARDDAKFIEQAIDKMIELTCIDTNRIYIIGYSGGARMASHLACVLSHRIASIVAISGIRFSKSSDIDFGLHNSSECSPSRAIYINVMHGYWDPINTWYEKELGQTPFVNLLSFGKKFVATTPKRGSSWSYAGETALVRWVGHNRCDAIPNINMLYADVEQHEYINCRDGGGVRAIFFHNIGHAVPGYDSFPLIGQGKSMVDGFAMAWELVKNDSISY